MNKTSTYYEVQCRSDKRRLGIVGWSEKNWYVEFIFGTLRQARASAKPIPGYPGWERRIVRVSRTVVV